MFEAVLKPVLGLILLLTFSQAITAADRYALVVGIDNYPKSRKLDGSVRDATKFGEFISGQRFTEIKVLTNEQATRKAILGGFNYFRQRVKTGDAFYFFFAGHGTIFPDNLSDERDESSPIRDVINPETGKKLFRSGNYDSAICPYDHKTRTSKKKWGNIILDDELFNEFSKFAAKGSLSILISDSCHSGTLSRTDPAISGNDKKPRKYRYLLPDEAYDQPADDTPADQSGPTMFKLTTLAQREQQLKGKYIALTAAADDQLAEEIFFDKVKGEMGVFTFYLLEILEKNPNINFDALIAELARQLKAKNRTQIPQLENRFSNGDLKKLRLLNPQ